MPFKTKGGYMIKNIRKHLPSEIVRNQRGFTFIGILFFFLIMMIIFGLVIMSIIYLISGPRYTEKAFTQKGEQKYYNLVCLPESGVLLGVCSGIGYKLGISPWIPRACFIFLFIGYGSGVLLYILLYLIIPTAHTPPDYLERTGDN
jgi:phage shock protein PspC (stress-responsive transcriptional regulator)